MTELFISADLSFNTTTKDDVASNLEFFVIPHQPSVNLIYDEATGELRLETNSPLEALEVVSANGLLNADPA